GGRMSNLSAQCVNDPLKLPPSEVDTDIALRAVKWGDPLERKHRDFTPQTIGIWFEFAVGETTEQRAAAWDKLLRSGMSRQIGLKACVLSFQFINFLLK